jgi:hypothetical protein
MTDRRRRRPTLDRLIRIAKVTNNRRARNQAIRSIYRRDSDMSMRALARLVGLSHASISRIVNNRQGLGESGARATAAQERWRSRAQRG